MNKQNSVNNLPIQISRTTSINKTSGEYLRQDRKSMKSHLFVRFTSQHMCRDISHAFNQL